FGLTCLGAGPCAGATARLTSTVSVLKRLEQLLGATCLALTLTGCSGQSAPPTPTDPFSGVAQQANDAYAQGMALYEQGRTREALDAFNRARLLSPTDDPRITEMIQRVSTSLTPTAAPVPPTPIPTIVVARATL